MSAPVLLDPDLRFGLQALHLGFVTHDQLLEAMSVWLGDRQTPLAEVLTRRGFLDEGCRAAVARSVEPLSVGHGVPALPSTTAPVGGATAPHFPGAAMRYSPLREHARGGLGEIHLALDEELGREVALKQIQGCFADDPGSRARFLREARITGHLEHPGVVPVYGLGVHTDGRPYYAMRFIKGEPLHQAIARFHAPAPAGRDPGEVRLALRDLLGRFVAVCAAVSYAHAQGVIHRDLKPSNVMLGPYGETLVVDWGLAKVFDEVASPGARRPIAQGADAQDAAHTLEGQVVGTPAFMSPEQARGEVDALGPRSDVFSLGAILYCLLTGEPPYAGGGTEALPQARQGEVPAARVRNPAVPRALEAVCARAMAPSAADRYADARALGHEVERWLADEPVNAYREPLADRAFRWGRRNRGAVRASAVLLLAGIAGLIFGLWAVNRERERTKAALHDEQVALGRAEVNLGRALKAEEDAKANLAQSEENLKLARDAIDQCYNVTRDAPEFQQPRMNAVKTLLLKKALTFYVKFRNQRPKDRGLQREEAEQWYRIAYIQSTTGDHAGALKTAEKALAVYVALAGKTPDIQAKCDLAAMHNSMGVMLDRHGKKEEAWRHHQESLRIFTELDREFPGSEVIEDSVAEVNYNMETHAHLEEARKTYSRLAQAHPNKPKYQHRLAMVYLRLGYFSQTRGRPKEAQEQYEESRKIQARLVAASRTDPNLHEYQSGLATAHYNLATLLKDQGKHPQARRHYNEALKVAVVLARTHSDMPWYRKDLANIHAGLGEALVTGEEREEALKHFAEAIKLFTELAGQHRDVPEYRKELAHNLNNSGVLLKDLDRHGEARKLHEESRKHWDALARAYPADPIYRDGLAEVHNNLGLLHMFRGERDDALRQFTAASALREAVVKERPTVASYRLELGGNYCNQGHMLREKKQHEASLARYDRAVRELTEAMRLSPDEAKARLYLRNASFGRALAKSALGRDAGEDWDRTVALSPPEERAMLRLSRARAGDYGGAEEVVRLAGSDEMTGQEMYSLARTQALNARNVARAASRPLPLREKLAERYSRDAVKWLNRVAGGSFFLHPMLVQQVKEDPDMSYLRGSELFRRLQQ